MFELDLIIKLKTIDSTQNFAKNIIDMNLLTSFFQNKENYKAAILTNEQTNGQARNGFWKSEKETDFLVSYIFKMPENFQHLTICLSTLAACSICKVLEAYDVYPKLKWVNDLFLGKKIAGILCEVYEGYIILGIGLNVNSQEKNYKTSLKEKTGIDYNIEEIFQKITLRLFQDIESLKNNGYSAFSEYFVQRMFLKNKQVQLIDNDKVVAQGEIIGVDSKSGGLLLKEYNLPFLIAYTLKEFDN